MGSGAISNNNGGLRMTVRVRLLAIAVVAALAATTAASQPASAAPTPSPAPAPVTTPGGLAPNAIAPAVTDPNLHIVKDESSAASCSGYRSQTTPPNSIRVLITSTKTIATVGFENYVENVLPNEWVSSWDGEALKAGAVAVKSYGWFWVNHYGGYYGATPSSTNCFDVTDDTNFQVYRANSAQTRTNDAVQQTWSVIARDAGTHEVRQTFYRADLATHTGSAHDTCGQAANGSTMSQNGTQACAHTLNEPFTQILNAYYFAVPANSTPALELATATLGPVSPPRPGPVVLSSLGTLVAYREAGTNILATSQSAAGQRFGPWSTIDHGPVFTGQPTAVKTVNNTLAVFARSNGRIEANGQQAVGQSFSGWVSLGASSPTVPDVASDAEVLTAPSGALVVYVTAGDGNVWGIGQSAANGSWGVWQRLTATGGYSGKPAALVTASGLIVIYARNGAVIQGSGQSRRGGTFSTWAAIGSGGSSTTSTGDPSVFQAGDGTLSVVDGGQSGNPGAIWMVGQPAPGVGFGTWRQVSASGAFSSTVAAVPVRSAGPIVLYAANSGMVQGAQAVTPASQFTTFGNMGTGSPQAAGDPSTLFAANGAIVIYVIGADGFLWGAGQSAPGSFFSGWGHIGS